MYFDKHKLMHMWRYAVVMYLRPALQKGLLASEASLEELSALLKTQYERWWNEESGTTIDEIPSCGGAIKYLTHMWF